MLPIRVFHPLGVLGPEKIEFWHQSKNSDRTA
jgi:hypothetical protein